MKEGQAEAVEKGNYGKGYASLSSIVLNTTRQDKQLIFCMLERKIRIKNRSFEGKKKMSVSQKG